MQNLIRWLLRLLMHWGIIRNLSTTPPPPTPGPAPTPITRKVLMITHNPVLRSQGGRTLKEYFGWQDPDTIAQGYSDDLKSASYGYITYEIVERLVVDAFPLKADGFRYDEASYLQAWQTRSFHLPDGVDYLALVREFAMIEKINSGAIDEVWLFGHPYGGYYESIMAGPGGFWCNAPALAGTQHAARRFIIMGFNFERGVGEMLESFGHRAEAIMDKVYAGRGAAANTYQRFIRYDRAFPGQAECGNVHYAPNSEHDYDWGNPRQVMSRCDNWYNFPDLSGAPRLVDAREWGGGDIRAHHLWWLRHFPHVGGSINGISNNWWEYIIDPNRV
ncbi:MAG: hypothetical protein HXY40_17645 [Chloroflexi bacterium]|nr:hypothetical protein [Chloroflexota bacterium]